MQDYIDFEIDELGWGIGVFGCRCPHLLRVASISKGNARSVAALSQLCIVFPKIVWGGVFVWEKLNKFDNVY